MYAEVIFETGAHSIVSYDDEQELKDFLLEHQRRAVNGEPGASQEQTPRPDIANDFAAAPSIEVMKSRPAERVKKVYTYDEHPADLVPPGNNGVAPVDAKAVQKLVDGMADKKGIINAHQLIQALRDEASPVYPVDQGRFDSMYKMEGNELDLKFLKDAEKSDEGDAK